ncbi:hypothetical protein [Acuticoccus yangtzensis]|uniref:hypothetical protein n=1 Tax=Acuticoccus yangtzensis TaxID=1443441 RepID=UPI000949A3BE|nr:hypothetical protein [Acuticoccus yangtzensis]
MAVAGACCDTLAAVLKGPGEGAEPALFLDEDGALAIVVATLPTPGGLGFFDKTASYCPFCGAAQRIQDNQAQGVDS